MNLRKIFSLQSRLRLPSLRRRRPQVAEESTELADHVESRLQRYSDDVGDGLDSAFVPEALGNAAIENRPKPFERIERPRPR
jgi:hypothetical protein